MANLFLYHMINTVYFANWALWHVRVNTYFPRDTRHIRRVSDGEIWTVSHDANISKTCNPTRVTLLLYLFVTPTPGPGNVVTMLRLMAGWHLGNERRNHPEEDGGGTLNLNRGSGGTLPLGENQTEWVSMQHKRKCDCKERKWLKISTHLFTYLFTYT